MMLFWEKGFQETSLDQVAQAVGVKKPSLYCAFGDKETLFQKVVQRYNAKFGQPAMRVLEDHQHVHEALNAFFNRGIAYACGNGTPRGCLLATAFSDSQHLPPKLAAEIKALINQTDRVIARRLEKAVRSGQLPAGFDAKGTAKYLNTVMHGLTMRARAGESEASLRNVIRIALSFVADGRAAPLR
jgi:AcrR family transcriptional regulator